jgi:hypothetical protein
MLSHISGSSGKRVPPIFFTRRREAAKKEKEENVGSEQQRAGSGETACFVLRRPGSRYCRRKFPATDLTCFPGPGCILLLFFFAALPDLSMIRLRVQTVQVRVCRKTLNSFSRKICCEKA